jgi:hypothetical protein
LLTAARFPLLRRLRPRLLAYLLGNRYQRARMSVVGTFARCAPLRRLLQKYLLLEQVSLSEAAGNPLHAVSGLDPEPTPEPILFPGERFAEVVDAYSERLQADPFRLRGYPDADPRAVFEGGLLLVREPVAGMLYVPPARYHCTLRAAFLNLDNGGLCTAAGSMVTDCVPRNRKGARLKSATFYGRLRPRRAPRLSGHYATIWGKWAGFNYYHWLIEALPRLARLAALRGAPQPVLLMPRSMPPVWEESLACCLPEGMVVRRASGWLRPESLVFSSHGLLQPAAWLDAQERDYVRGAVFRRYGLDASARGGRRLFISRAGAQVRRLVNEEEVTELLERRGFETIHLERLSFEEQVRLFHGASDIVAPHGAGLSNLMFAGPVRVLELFAQDTFKPLYFLLARSLGQRYRFLAGGAKNRLLDFRVDAESLRRAVADLLAGEAAEMR